MTDFLQLTSDTLTAQISPYGAALARLWIEGHDTSLILGLPSPEDYADAPHEIGVIVGPLAGRIAQARTSLNGKPLSLPQNAPPHSLHSGPEGLQHRLWHIEAQSGSAVTLRCDLPDGACGLPGARSVRTRYSLDGSDLTIEITTTSDQDTFFNAASHAYWTLDGSGDLSAHRLTVAAEEQIETGPDLIPTGRLLPLTGTDHDFRTPRSPVTGAPLDGTFALTSPDCLHLTSTRSGVSLDVETNQPGLVLYTGAGLPQLTPPPATPPIIPFAGLAIEAQGWPDAPNQPEFPSVLLRKEAHLSQITRFRLSIA